MTGFTIKAINDDGSVDVAFDVDKKVQNLSGMPVNDAELLTGMLAAYGEAYAAGLEQERVEIHPDVQALVGQRIEP